MNKFNPFKDLYSENHKTLIKEIEDKSKQKDYSGL